MKEGTSVLGVELTESVAVSSLESDVTFHETQILISWSSTKTSDVTCTSRYGGGRSRSLVPFGPLGRYDVSFNLLVSEDRDRPSVGRCQCHVPVRCQSQVCLMAETQRGEGRREREEREKGPSRRKDYLSGRRRDRPVQRPRQTFAQWRLLH